MFRLPLHERQPKRKSVFSGRTLHAACRESRMSGWLREGENLIFSFHTNHHVEFIFVRTCYRNQKGSNRRAQSVQDVMTGEHELASPQSFGTLT